MALWRITFKGPEEIGALDWTAEGLLEERLEGWTVANPSLLGESLCLVGRQVPIPGTSDQIDLLALDPQGAAVIIELVCGPPKASLASRALGHASYVSQWKFENFEYEARKYCEKVCHPDFDLLGLLKSFYGPAAVSRPGDLNQEQRIVLLGSFFGDELLGVAGWLAAHRVGIKVIEVKAFGQDENILIESTVLVPSQAGQRDRAEITSIVTTRQKSDRNISNFDRRRASRTKRPFLTLDDILARLKPKVFVSFHHATDQEGFEQFARAFGDGYAVACDPSPIGHLRAQLPASTDLQTPEDYIRDASVTVVLCGPETWKRKYVDWEIHSALQHGRPLLGIALPAAQHPSDNRVVVPQRLHANIMSGYAHFASWPDNPAALESAIEEAMRKSADKTRIDNTLQKMQWHIQ